MLQPAETDWVRRGNSSVVSSFDRPLSCTLLPLSFLRQENRIQRRSDKLQVLLGIPLSGIDQSCYFTSEVPPPDLDYDFIAACIKSQKPFHLPFYNMHVFKVGNASAFPRLLEITRQRNQAMHVLHGLFLSVLAQWLASQ